MKNRILPYALAFLSSVLLSLPWLVPGCGLFALVGFIPLLMADDLADRGGCRHFFLVHYLCFVLWNAFTTFWVCNATVGGGVFAVLANAFQMSLVWALFRLSKRVLTGPLPYIFLAVMWIAWERSYFSVDISWPWLVLGNAFAGSVKLVQWYELTGHLGGSLWIWAANLGIYGLLTAFADGHWFSWNRYAKLFSALSLSLLLVVPVGWSLYRYSSYEPESCGSLDVVVSQPNFDPYEKFHFLSQAQQNAVVMELWDSALASRDSSAGTPVLLLAPETFTSDVVVNDISSSPTVQSFQTFRSSHPGTDILFGASSYEYSHTSKEPSDLARKVRGAWVQSRNSAIMLSEDTEPQIFHKSKLVVAVESTPYPKIFVPIDEWLSKKLGYAALMGRCEGQKEISLLKMNDSLALGCAVCYESIYGEYCTDYVRKGAKAMTVITNDAWWGDTPGYRQHLNYSRLRAVELRRDIARCANTGISGFINSRGELVQRSDWWQREVLTGKVNLSEEVTPFVRYGDICGRVCTFAFLLLALLILVRFLQRR